MSVEVCMLTGRRSGHVSTSVSFGRPARGRAATSGGILSNEELTVHTRHHSFSHGKQRYTEASARPGLSQRQARAQSHTLVVDESGRLVRAVWALEPVAAGDIAKVEQPALRRVSSALRVRRG